MTSDIRWRQRFENLDRAVMLLRDALSRGAAALSQLEKEGTIQRFEMAFELAWKTVNDYLTQSGIHVTPVTPRQVLKKAFNVQILTDGQVWIDMLDHRNLLAHTYDIETFETAVVAIENRYLPALESLRDWFRARPVE